MEDPEITSLLSEAFKVVKSGINYCEAKLEGGWEECGSSHVATEVLTEDCARLLANKEGHGVREVVDLCKELQHTGKMDYDILTSRICQSLEWVGTGVWVELVQQQVVSLSSLLVHEEAWQHLRLRVCEGEEIRSNSDVRGMWRLLVGEALGADMEEAGGEDAAAMVGTEDSLPKTNLPKMFILEHFSDCAVRSDYDAIVQVVRVFTDVLTSQRTRNYVGQLLFARLVLCPPLDTAADGFGCLESLGASSPEALCCSEVAGIIEDTELLELLRTMVDCREEANWKFVLQFVSSCLLIKSSFRELLSVYLMGGMEEAVVEMDSVAFLRLLLLSHLVDDLDHKLWLERSLGKVGFCSTNISFVVSNLTTAVPYQSVQMLKAYLDVFLSRKSDSGVFDFVQLVRARLADLNYTMSSGSRDKAETLVKKWTSEYRETGSIPQGLIKTSVFMAPFFVGHVVPLLMQPAEEVSVQKMLLEELYKRGKIPKKMYNQYLSQQSVSEGSSDVEEVDTEALCTLISDMVKEMVVKIQSCEVSSDRVDLSELVCRHGADLKKAVGQSNLPQIEQYSLDAPGIIPWQIIVVDELISILCTETCKLDAMATLVLVTSMVDLVCPLKWMFWPFIVRMLELLHEAMAELSDEQLRGLASVASSYVMSGKTLGLGTGASLPFKNFSELGTFIVKKLPVSTKATMKASRSFLQFFLKFLSSVHGFEAAPLPQAVSEKMCFLNSRFACLDQELRTTGNMNKFQLSFSSWLELELQIEPSQDFLSVCERESYWHSSVERFRQESGNSGFIMEDDLSMVTTLVETLCRSHHPSHLMGVALLQRLLWTSVTTMDTSGCSLLSEAVVCLAEQDGNRSCFSGIIQILTLIPGSFLFTNNPAEKLACSNLQSAGRAISTILAVSRASSFLLPPSFVWHLVKALHRPVLVEQLCQLNQHFYSSLLMAARTHKSLKMDGYISPSLLQQMEEVSRSNWSSVSDLPAEVAGLCAFESCLKDQCDEVSRRWSIHHFMKEAGVQATEVLFNCCLCQISRNCWEPCKNSRSVAVQVAQMCLQQSPAMISMCAVDTSSTHVQNIRSAFKIQKELFPVLFFSVLQGLSDVALNRVFSLGVEILHMCLNYHHELLQLQYLSHVTSVEAFDIEFIMKSVDITKCIMKASKHECEKCTHHWTLTL